MKFSKILVEGVILLSTSLFNISYAGVNSASVSITVKPATVNLSCTAGKEVWDCSVSFPVGTESFNPSVNLEASVTPNIFKKNSITKKTTELEEEQEKMNIRNARIDFADKVTAQELELSNILWERTSNEENLSMYQTLETDLAEWYKQGIVTQSEYLSAKVNRQKCSVAKVSNLIEMILYNDEVNSLFVSDLKNEPFERLERRAETDKTDKTDVETDSKTE